MLEGGERKAFHLKKIICEDTVTVTLNTILPGFKDLFVSRHTAQHGANWQIWCSKMDSVETR